MPRVRLGAASGSAAMTRYDRLAAEHPADPREAEAREVRAAARAADEDVGLLARERHLLDRLEADHRLVEQDVVEHRAQRVLRVVAGRRVLDRLADRHPQRPRRVRVRGQHRAAVVRRRAGARDDLGAVRLHEHPAIRLLVVARPDLVDLDLEAEQGAGEGERAPPLPGAGLGGDPLRARLLVVERLGDRGVRLVRPGRADALVLVVDVGRGIEDLLEPVGPVERRRAVQRVRVADRVRDLDLALGADLLEDQRHREQRLEVGGPDRLVGPRVERRRRRHRQVGRDVVPGPRDPVLVEDELRAAGVADGHRAGPPVTGGGSRSLRLRRRRRSTRRRAEHDGLDRVVARRAAAEDAVVQDDRPGPGTCVDQSPAAASSACEARAPSAIDVRSVRATVRWGANGFTSAGQPRSARRSVSAAESLASSDAPSAMPSHSARTLRPCSGKAPAPASRTSNGGRAVDRREHGLGDVGHLVGRGVAEEAERDVERVEVDPAWRGAERLRADRLDELADLLAGLGRDGDGDEQARGCQAPCSSRYRSRSASSTSRARSWSRQPTTSTSFSSSSL